MRQDKSYVFSSLGYGSIHSPTHGAKALVWGGVFGVGLFFLSGALMTNFGQDVDSWQSWYQGLVKSSLTPPNWVFSPVWFVLYVLMGLTTGRLIQAPYGRPPLKVWGVWILQIGLNLAWTPLFFLWKMPFWALVDLVGLTFCLTLFLGFVRRRDGLCFWLTAPYMVWTLFALWLNTSIVLENRQLLPDWLVVW